MRGAVKREPSGQAGPRGRGRPRSDAARRAMLRAARELLEEGGVAAVTMEGVAARAGVGKPTVYRAWPNAHAVGMAALMEELGAAKPVRAAGSAIKTLRQQLRNVAEVFATRMGRNVAVMLAAAESETELSKAFRNHFILARRAEGRTLLEAAILQRELRRDLDIETTLDLIYGPVFYRLLVGQGTLDAQFTDSILSHALRGLAAASPSHRSQAPGPRGVRRHE